MKTMFTKYCIIFVVMLEMVTSCEIKDLDNIKQPYVLGKEKAINSLKTSELALTGVYSALVVNPGAGFTVGNLTIIPVLMGTTGSLMSEEADEESLGFFNNRPMTGRNQNITKGCYTKLYEMINRCNFVVEGTTRLLKVDRSDLRRKKEIIAEAKTLRALAHFYLLRLWGQFYASDENSQYGIVVKTDNKNIRPRSSVRESYKAIINDLDFGIENAPDLRAKYFVSKTFAKGLKAKVMLYQGGKENYGQAASLAYEVMSQKGNFDLTENFADIFDHSSRKIYRTKENLFCVLGADQNHDEIASNGWNGGRGFSMIQFSQNFIKYALGSYANIGGQKIEHGGSRLKDWVIQKKDGKVAQVKKYKHRESKIHGESYETFYHLRMAEIYLIFAEADARSKGIVTKEALKALNDVRRRSGAKENTGADYQFETYPDHIGYHQFLEAVRMDKMMELFGEMGEHWFDLVRYDYADGFGTGFTISEAINKRKANKPEFFILPIPSTSVRATRGLVKQNPGYLDDEF